MFARIYLALNAVMIGLIGLAYLYDPNLLLANYGLETGTAAMDNMLRAAYGGLSIGVAALMAIGFLRPQRRSDALAFTALYMGTLALGRAASLMGAGMPGPSVMMLFYYEIAAAVIGVALYRHAQKAG